MRRSKNDHPPGYVYYVDNPAQFKLRNQTEWQRNAEFWLEGKMRHVLDLFDTVVVALRQLLDTFEEQEAELLVIDAGCGEGWAIRALEEADFAGRYVGLDFNPPFIDALRVRYANNAAREFRVHDLESPPPDDLRGRGTLVLNFFNLFEVPQLDAAFGNIAQMLAPGGALLILHIDPMTQLFAVSSSLSEFRRNLKLYEQHRAYLGYDKDIDVGDRRSGKFYRSLLYSASDYFRCARSQGLICENLHEIVKTGNSIPQIYQMLQFRRPL